MTRSLMPDLRRSMNKTRQPRAGFNYFELYEDKPGWFDHSNAIRKAADVLIEKINAAEKWGATDTASREAIVSYIVDRMI